LSGALHLTLRHDAARNRTILSGNEERPPLRVLRAFHRDDGSALVHLHNVSGGVLGGDHLDLRIALGPASDAQITTTGATRVYRCRDGAASAVQSMRLSVADGGSLEYLPDPVIPFAGSRYAQHTRVELGRDSTLYWWETFAPGRDGESFSYHTLETSAEIVVAGRLIARERWTIVPKERNPASLVRLAGYRYHSTFYVCCSGARDWLALEAELAELARGLTGSRLGRQVWSVSMLAAHGLVIRGLASNAREIAAGLGAFWRAGKMLVSGREAIPPRKLY
jgi:urease accessory protein